MATLLASVVKTFRRDTTAVLIREAPQKEM